MEPVKRIKTEALDSNEEPPETVVTHEDVKVKKLEPKRRPLSQLFEGMVFCVSGIVNPERAQVRQSALDMGGVFKNDWDDECTVLLCPFLSTPKVRQVQSNT